jgi:tetratricopeptide (TPR) repeat protein
MNFPPEAFEDYFAIVNEEGVRPGERFTDVLDRRDTDLFFGMGTPNPATFLYSTPDLEAEAEWLLVHRSLDHAIYQRRAPNHSGNLARVAAFYSAQGIPFDSELGLNVSAILREHTQWAIDTRMLPTRYPQLLMRMRAGNRQALKHLAIIHLLLGDYSAAIRFDQKILVLDSEAHGARRRLVYGLLKLGRVKEASAHAQALAVHDGRRDLPRNAPSLRKLVQRGLEIERSGGFDTVSPQIRDAWRRDLNSLYPITDREHQTIMRSLLLPPPTLAAPRRDGDGSSLPPSTSRK